MVTMEDTLALWVLCAAALMLGSMFAIIVPSKVDAVLGLCFGEFIQIGETYKVRLGDQTFKPYGNNTTYL